MLTENQRYVSDVLKTFIRLFHLTGPKCETIEESRFILSNGCCYEVRSLLIEACLAKGIPCRSNDHSYHAWIEVDGKAFDSLCPEGVKGSVGEYWLMYEISPGRDYSVDREGTEASSYPIDYCWRYVRLYVAQKAFCKLYGLKSKSTYYRNDKRRLKRLQRRLARRQEEMVIVSTHPLPSSMTYFTDSIEKTYGLNIGRVLLPYPYRLSLRFWLDRMKDLKKRGIPIWQM